MQGDQQAREENIFRAIDVSPSGLTVKEIEQQERTGFRTTYEHLQVSWTVEFPFCIPPHLSGKAEKFSKQVLNFSTLEIYLFQFLDRISPEKKDLCILGALACGEGPTRHGDEF